MQNTKELQEVTNLNVTQFELTKDVLLRLHEFDITPVTKLVLLYLTSCYNPKNSTFVFPKTETIAEVLGLGITSVKGAISSLIKQGIILKDKQKRSGNYNKYILTGNVTRPFKSTKSVFSKVQNPTVSIKEQKREQKNLSEELQKKSSNKLSESQREKIEKYVEGRNDISNKQAYYNKLINSDCTLLLKKLEEPERIKRRAEAEIARTKARIEKKVENVESFESSAAWKALGEKIKREKAEQKAFKPLI